jgi:hypothetical protein
LAFGCRRESTPADESIPERAQVSNHLISDDELEVLQSEGLADPIREIVSSLRAHPELIMHEGVLGGQMGFYSPEGIYVLNAKIVFARFTDGHIEGSGVFEFSVGDDGSITWRVLNSRIEGPPVAVPPSSSLQRSSGAEMSLLAAGIARR